MPAHTWQPTATVENLRRRAHLLQQIRAFFAARDVIEIQTPVLASHTVTDPSVASFVVQDGGFLQPSPEYLIKRLLAAGLGSCYQMAPVFRAGEAGRLHNPEFTLLEWYQPGYDDVRLRDEVAALVDVVLGSAPYQTVTYRQLVGEPDGGNGDLRDGKDGQNDAGKIRAPGADRDALDLAFAEATAALSGRWFVVDYPADQAMLARRLPGQPDLAARFELVIDGIEIANGYYELGDAQELAQRFAQDNHVRAARGLPTQAVDESFLQAMQHGMPDCAGVALGVDRLVMLALGATHINEVLTFPWQRR